MPQYENLLQFFSRIPQWVWLVICLAIAAFYTVVYPQQNTPPDTLRYIILRWFHALVWLILALSFLIRMNGRPRLANTVALLALPVYTVFMFTAAT